MGTMGIWTGNGATTTINNTVTTNWFDPANWLNGLIPKSIGDTATIQHTHANVYNLIINLDQSITLSGLFITSGVFNLSFSGSTGSTLTITQGIISWNPPDWSDPNSLTFTVPLQIQGNVTLGAGELNAINMSKVSGSSTAVLNILTGEPYFNDLTEFYGVINATKASPSLNGKIPCTINAIHSSISLGSQTYINTLNCTQTSSIFLTNTNTLISNTLTLDQTSTIFVNLTQVPSVTPITITSNASVAGTLSLFSATVLPPFSLLQGPYTGTFNKLIWSLPGKYVQGMSANYTPNNLQLSFVTPS